MVRQDTNLIATAFYNAQFNQTCHKNYQQKLKTMYEKTDLEKFFDEFIGYLMIPLSMNDKHPRVNNCLQFAANFAVSLYSVDTESEEHMCPFLTKLFDWLLSHHNAKDLSARYEICRFLNMLLNSMGDDAFIDDDLCNKITTNMIERMQDKSPRVRTQAVLALHRLQDPMDKDCPVIKTYIIHVLRDPSSDVRKTILISMGKNKKTLSIALKKIRDINEEVRKMAYLFLSKVTVRSLSIEQREFILSNGLKDTSEKVLKCVQNILLPSWLRNYNNDYISLLKGLDAENASEVAMSCLHTLFKNAVLQNIIEQTAIDENKRVIPIEKLSSENVVYWHCLMKHCRQEGYTEPFEELMPELSPFCSYIREYMDLMNNAQPESWEHISQKFILNQLFEMTKLIDLSDETGRGNLRQLILDTLLSKHLSDNIIECIVNYMEQIVPIVNERLNLLTYIISELRMPTNQQIFETQVSEDELHEKRMKKANLRVKLCELTEEQEQAIANKDFIKAEEMKHPILEVEKELMILVEEPVAATPVISEEIYEEEKNDPETIWKCLKIMCIMMQSNSIKSLTPTCRTLMENLALTNINHENGIIRTLALTAVAICCLLDGELAKKHLITFIIRISTKEEHTDVLTTSLKAIIDLLHCYGLDHFNISQTEEELDKSRKNRSVRLYKNDDTLQDTNVNSMEDSSNIIKFLIRLLDSNNQDFRTIAGEGLCKLLLTKRISSPHLLSRLIVLLQNPISEGDAYLTRCLCSFLNYFATKIPESQLMLEEAFLPTIRTLENAPEYSPLQEVDPLKVAEMILGLTRSDVPDQKLESHSVHNNLIFSILCEILNPDSIIRLEVLVKSLKYLDVQIETQTLKKDLLVALMKAEKIIEAEQKNLLKYLEQFKINLETPSNDGNQEEIQKEIDEE